MCHSALWPYRAVCELSKSNSHVPCTQWRSATAIDKTRQQPILQFVHLSNADTPYDAYHTKMTVSYSTVRVPCRTYSSVHAALL